MKSPRTMTPGEINRELTRLEKHSTALNDLLINVGRGSERYSEIVRKNDPLSLDVKATLSREYELRDEIQRRTGTRHSRMPKGFKGFKG